MLPYYMNDSDQYRNNHSAMPAISTKPPTKKSSTRKSLIQQRTVSSSSSISDSSHSVEDVIAGSYYYDDESPLPSPPCEQNTGSRKLTKVTVKPRRIKQGTKSKDESQQKKEFVFNENNGTMKTNTRRNETSQTIISSCSSNSSSSSKLSNRETTTTTLKRSVAISRRQSSNDSNSSKASFTINGHSHSHEDISWDDSYRSNTDVTFSPSNNHYDHSHQYYSPAVSDFTAFSRNSNKSGLLTGGFKSLRRFSNLPYIPRIVNTMKYDLKRIEQLEQEIANVTSELQTELSDIKKHSSAIMIQIEEQVARSQTTTLLDPGELEELTKLTASLREENATIREHNEQLRTNYQKSKINNRRLEGKSTEVEEYRARLTAHRERVSAENEKLRASEAQYENKIQALQDKVNQVTREGQDEQRMRAMFERQSCRFVEILRLYDKDNMHLHRLVDEFISSVDSEKNSWPPSQVDRKEVKRDAALQRRSSMRECI